MAARERREERGREREGLCTVKVEAREGKELF